jgi:hypothetical protein
MANVYNYGGPAANINLGGAPYNGWSPQQTILNYKDSEQTRIRRVLRSSWNTQYATGKVNGYNRITTPFRAVNNLGDFLAREDYSCGGPNPVKSSYLGKSLNFISGTIPQTCDNTGVPASSCNPKFVSDSSDYTTYAKQKAINSMYNDLKNGGDQSNASFVPLKAVRRF